MMKHNPNTSRFWDAYLAPTPSMLEDDFITKDRISLIASLIPDKQIKVLDIGAGYGFLEIALQKKEQVSVFGMDISIRGITRLKSSNRGFFFIGTATNLPVINDSFDYVCLMEVLEHLYSNEGKKALIETKRVLRRDGRLIISIPLYDPILKNHPSGHVRTYTPNLIFSELDTLGFDVVNKTYLYAFSSHYKFKSLLSRLFKLRKPNNIIIFARKK